MHFRGLVKSTKYWPSKITPLLRYYIQVRIHLSNLRCEARTLLEQRNVLENAEREARDKATTVIKELGVCRLKISQVKKYSYIS